MQSLGFEKQGRHWVHPATRFWVEFPPGPVQVGDAVVLDFAERPTSVGPLRLLHPTECVMDRLAGYVHWNDRQCLDQAVAVARTQEVDLQRIESWAHSKGGRAIERVRDFHARLREIR
jgi:hypothetical protein